MFKKKIFQCFLSEKFSRKRFVLEWMSMFIILSFLILLLFYSRKIAEVEGFRDKVKATEKSVVMMQSAMIDTKLEGVSSNLRFISKMHSMDRLLNTDDKTMYEKYRLDFQNELSLFIQVNNQYDQIRYIDSDGVEIVRINYDGDNINIVDIGDLQNKGERYYFKDTMKLSKEQIYQSPLDLNVENGVVESPEKPMIRFATRVFDDDGNSKGIVIINYNASLLLDRFEEMSMGSSGSSYLLNNEGNFLSGDEELNFDFMYRDDPKGNINYLYPRLWYKINSISSEDGIVQRYGRNGFMTYSEISIPEDIVAKGKWYVLTGITIEENKYCTSEDTMSIVISEYIYNSYYLFVSFVLSFFIVLSLSLYRKNINAISEMATFDKLTGTYTRSRGLELIDADFQYARKTNCDYSICFIDLNDLKKVNDKFGHEMGDMYLKESVDILRERMGNKDCIVRMGGDEFLIGIFKSKKEIECGWESVNEEIRKHNEKNQKPYDVSLSHGVVSINEEGFDLLKDMIDLADKRMYEEKRIMKKKKG